MPAKNLTDAFVRSATPINGKLTEYSDTKERGLCLRVTPAGVKSWTYRYRTNSGKQRRISLGKLDVVSLTNARKAVRKEKAAVDDGRDPAADKMMVTQLAKAAMNKESVADIGEWYFRECKAGRHKPNIKAPKRQSTLRVELFYFHKHIKPDLGKLKLADIPRATIQAFVDKLADKHSKSAARHCRVVLHSIYSFAERQEITEKNPCRYVTVAAHKPRERVLTNAELKTIWQKITPPVDIEDVSISNSVAYAILLAMVTLQRRGEVTGMHLDEIDLEQRVWVIPSNRTKNHRTHVVPLSDLAMELIGKGIEAQSKSSRYLFPSPRADDKPINPQALTRAFIRMREALKLEDIRPHDFRRTGATNLTGEALGFSRFAVSKVLNHTSDTGNAAAVTSVYDRNEYLSEKRRALDAWALRLLEIVEDRKQVDNVVSIVQTSK